MDSDLKLPFWNIDCSREIIFKKYNKKSNEVIRLDINIDLFPKEKGIFYADEFGNKSSEILYVDLSSKEFIVYNEDLKKCGYYDYNNEKIRRQKLPLNKKIVPSSCISNTSLHKKIDKQPKHAGISNTFSESFKENETIFIGGKKFLKTKSGDILDSINNSIVGIYEFHTNEVILFTNIDKQEDERDVAKMIEFEGKKYLRSKMTGIIYDYIEFIKNGKRVVLGIWNETTNTIRFLEHKYDEDDECEEDDDDNKDKDNDIDYRDNDDILLQRVISESLKNISVIKPDKKIQNISGIKAEERVQKQQNKYTIKQRTTVKNAFQDEEMRKLLT